MNLIDMLHSIKVPIIDGCNIVGELKIITGSDINDSLNLNGKLKEANIVLTPNYCNNKIISFNFYFKRKKNNESI